ncbi:unnamed protein product [Rhodiola kirilowii]
MTTTTRSKKFVKSLPHTSTTRSSSFASTTGSREKQRVEEPCPRFASARISKTLSDEPRVSPLRPRNAPRVPRPRAKSTSKKMRIASQRWASCRLRTSATSHGVSTKDPNSKTSRSIRLSCTICRSSRVHKANQRPYISNVFMAVAKIYDPMG